MSLDWAALRRQFAPTLVDELQEAVAGPGPLRTSPTTLAARANVSPAEAGQLLEILARAGTLSRRAGFVCPCTERRELDAEEARAPACSQPGCGRSFEDGQKPLAETFFERDGAPTRDVPWVLALHGMNTVGAWQEVFAWHLATTYRHAVPVFVYKYGVVRPGAILRFRQRQLRQGLVRRIREIRARAQAAGYGGRPDVIAHSFGTWLVGHALESDPTLRLGRVILTGCILRPDFDWARLLAAGRVEAVLCHSAGRDVWARSACYFVPDSGPSGRRGFDDRRNVHHAHEPLFRHSDFFAAGALPDVFERVWTPFLTDPEPALARRLREQPPPPAAWSPPAWLFRARLLRWVVLALAAALAAFLGAALVVGGASLVRDLLA